MDLSGAMREELPELGSLLFERAGGGLGGGVEERGRKKQQQPILRGFLVGVVFFGVGD